MKVRVIGAGFSGLVSAYALQKRGLDVEVYEASPRVGGLLTTYRESWGLVEGAANAIRASKSVLEMAEDIGLELQPMRREFRKRYIYRGRPRQIPLNPLELTRFTAGIFRRSRPEPGQNAQQYCEAKFGYGATHYLIEPAVFGIFADRLENLSARLLYDYFFNYRSEKHERLRGSLAPKEGMEQLPLRLKAYLEESGVVIHLNTPGEVSGSGPTIIATEARAASEILENVDQWVSDRLKTVRYLPLTSITLGYSELQRDIRGFGCLFPQHEEFHSLGVLFNNDNFEERGPAFTETWLLPEVFDSDTGALERVLSDRGRFLDSQEPQEYKMRSWPRALPQYSVELEKLLDELVLPQGIYLMGNYMGRLGLAKILDQAHELAERIIENES